MQSTVCSDIYQKRYLEHQARKKEVLIEIMRQRHSDRMFGDSPPPGDAIADLMTVPSYCPSSCDRKAVHLRVVQDRDEKSLLGGLLVGGVGWIHRAHTIFLLFANPLAYKAGDEITYMPYLDAGVVIQQLYLTATSYDLACAYANPNIRDMNKQHFQKVFGSEIFCGAFAVGNKYKE